VALSRSRRVGTNAGKRAQNPDFVLNQPRYRGAQILLTRRNFGCGSLREHAPWALADYAWARSPRRRMPTSFNNCYRTGCCPSYSEAEVDRLFHDTAAFPVSG
jgi:3-isopropylmalate/(R)-2-methylmalate dehydratase small subunit